MTTQTNRDIVHLSSDNVKEFYDEWTRLTNMGYKAIGKFVTETVIDAHTKSTSYKLHITLERKLDIDA